MTRLLSPVFVSCILVVLASGCASKPGSEPDAHTDLGTGTAPALPETPDTGALAGEWHWVRTVTSVEVILAGDPTHYTIAFGEGGRLAVRADCNRGAGMFTRNGRLIAFGPIALTRMACPPGSMDIRFLQHLDGAGACFMAGDTLMIDLKLDSGTMRFTRGG